MHWKLKKELEKKRNKELEIDKLEIDKLEFN